MQLKEVILESAAIDTDRYDKTYPSELWSEEVSRDIEHNQHEAILRWVLVMSNSEELKNYCWFRIVEIYDDGTHAVYSF